MDSPESYDSQEGRRHSDKFVASYQQPDWGRLDARLIAFGSDAVYRAAMRTSQQHHRAIDAYRQALAIGDAVADTKERATKAAQDITGGIGGLLARADGGHGPTIRV
jgi:hypothetical protein